MRRPTATWFALAAIACGGHELPSGTYAVSPRCPVSDATPVALDDASALGFSANDLVDAVAGVFPAEALDAEGVGTGPHDLDVSFAAATARVETGLDCLSEPAVAVDGTLTIEAADGWFSASGPATLLGTDADPGSSYLDGQLPVEPSPELGDAADASSRGVPCAGSAVKVVYDVAVGFPPTAWGTALGSLYTEWCEPDHGVVVDETLYELVPADP